MKASPAARSSRVMYSSGWCAWSIEPGPQTTVGCRPPGNGRPRSRTGTVVVRLRPAAAARALGLRSGLGGEARHGHLAARSRCDPNGPCRFRRGSATSSAKRCEPGRDFRPGRGPAGRGTPSGSVQILRQDVARRAAVIVPTWMVVQGGSKRAGRVAARATISSADAVEFTHQLGRGHRWRWRRASAWPNGLHARARAVSKVTTLLCASTTSSSVGSPTITAAGHRQITTEAGDRVRWSRGRSSPRHRTAGLDRPLERRRPGNPARAPTRARRSPSCRRRRGHRRGRSRPAA